MSLFFDSSRGQQNSNVHKNSQEDPSSSGFESLLEKCQELYSTGDFDSCLSLIEKFSAFAKDSQMVKLNYFKAKVCMKREFYEEAEGIFQSILDTHPNKIRILYRLGMSAKRNRRLPDALSHFQNSLNYAQSKDMTMKIHIQLGSCCLLMGDLSMSEDSFKSALSSQACAESHACLAWLHLKKGSYDRAIEQIAACKISPDKNIAFYVKLRYLLALCFTHKKRFADALEVLSAADNFHSLCLSGMIYAIVGQLNDAKVFFDEAVLTDHRRWEAYHNLSIIYMRSGLWEESTEMRKKSVEFGGSQDTQDYVIPDLDIADFILEGSTNSPSHLNFKEIEKKPEDATGISVLCPSGDTDISKLPVSPLIGLPLVPVPSDKKFSSEFMKNLVTFCQKIAKKNIYDVDFNNEICAPNFNGLNDIIPIKRLPEQPLQEMDKKLKH